jgi:hypothetical protein
MTGAASEPEGRRRAVARELRLRKLTGLPPVTNVTPAWSESSAREFESWLSRVKSCRAKQKRQSQAVT